MLLRVSGGICKNEKVDEKNWSRKEPGRSWIEVRNQVYSFIVLTRLGLTVGVWGLRVAYSTYERSRIYS